MTPPAAPVAPGDFIAAKYRVDRVLGAGGMGVVVAATHTQLEQKVAIKFLLPEVATLPEVVARFLREARAAVRIHSEHVSRVLDVGTLDSGAPYMVMELLEGEDLADLVAKGGPLAPQAAAGYLLQALEAIAEAHSLGIVHRDLKPANLFLARRPSGPPVVKVLDFGISKAPLSAQEKALTHEAALMGSPAYMSPEQMKASRDVDARSDVWSLGVVLHELLSASLPFEGDTVATLVTATLFEPHRRLREARPGAPDGLQAVIDRCLEKDPARRFQDVAELAQALVPFGPPRCELSLERIVTVLGRQGGAVALAPTALVLPTAPALGGLPGTATLSPLSASPAARGRNMVIPGAVLGMLTVAVAAYALVRRPAAQTTAGAVPEERSAAASGVASVAPAPTVAPAPSVTTAPSVTAAPTAAEAPGPAAIPSPTAAARTPGGPGARSKPSASAPQKPPCKVVSYFDAEGNKHFKQECP